MIVLVLALATLAGSADPITHVVRMSPTDVAYVEVGDMNRDGQTDLFVLRHDGSSLLVKFDELRFNDGYVEAVLYFGEDNPTIFRSSYEDAKGMTHEIITNCGRFPANDSGSDRCVAEHERAIEAMLRRFPKEPNRETDVDFEIRATDRDVKPIGTGGVVILPNGRIIGKVEPRGDPFVQLAA